MPDKGCRTLREYGADVIGEIVRRRFGRCTHRVVLDRNYENADSVAA